MDREVVDFLVREKFLLFISIDGWREMHNYSRPSLAKDDLYDTIVQNALYASEQYRLPYVWCADWSFWLAPGCPGMPTTEIEVSFGTAMGTVCPGD